MTSLFGRVLQKFSFATKNKGGESTVIQLRDEIDQMKQRLTEDPYYHPDEELLDKVRHALGG